MLKRIAYTLMCIASSVIILAGIPGVPDIGGDVSAQERSVLSQFPIHDFLNPNDPIHSHTTRVLTGFLLVAAIIAAVAAIVAIVIGLVDLIGKLWNWIKTWDDAKDWERWMKDIKQEGKTCRDVHDGRYKFDDDSPINTYCVDEHNVPLETWTHSYFNN